MSLGGLFKAIHKEIKTELYSEAGRLTDGLDDLDDAIDEIGKDQAEKKVDPKKETETDPTDDVEDNGVAEDDVENNDEEDTDTTTDEEDNTDPFSEDMFDSEDDTEKDELNRKKKVIAHLKKLLLAYEPKVAQIVSMKDRLATNYATLEPIVKEYERINRILYKYITEQSVNDVSAILTKKFIEFKVLYVTLDFKLKETIEELLPDNKKKK